MVRYTLLEGTVQTGWNQHNEDFDHILTLQNAEMDASQLYILTIPVQYCAKYLDCFEQLHIPL